MFFRTPQRRCSRQRQPGLAWLPARPVGAAPLQTGEPPSSAPIRPVRSAAERRATPPLDPTSTRRRMFPKILTQIFGSRNDRLLKTYRRDVEKINALGAPVPGAGRCRLRAKTDEFRQRVAQGATLDESAARSLCRGARSRQAHAEDAPLRRAAGGRHRAAPGQDRRNAHRRRQDADGHAAGLPQRHCPARACTWSRSTTTWRAVTPNGWAGSMASWA
jgi:hypothetical protein